jgi:hypothetical protein
MIMHLGPAEDHKEDAHFIKYLRKVAVNQVAHAKMMEIKAAKVAKQLGDAVKPEPGQSITDVPSKS